MTQGDDAHPVTAAQRIVLSELLAEYPARYSTDELARLVGNRGDTTDALWHLESSGLVHRDGDYVWPTRPAVCFARLDVET